MVDFREHNKALVTAFRASGGHGEMGPVHFDRLVLLTTTGRRTGARHTTPLGGERDDAGNLVLFASNMGAPTDPDWYRNIVADPHVRVEITGASWDAIATIPKGADRDAAYELWTTRNPHVAGHQEQAGRPIPMVLVPPEGTTVRPLRVIADLHVRDIEAAKRFYGDVLGLTGEEFNLGWVARLSSDSGAVVQLVTRDETAPQDAVASVLTPDIDAAYERARDLGHEIVYPLTIEPWGVRRFFVRDPDGNVLNIVQHFR